MACRWRWCRCSRCVACSGDDDATAPTTTAGIVAPTTAATTAGPAPSAPLETTAAPTAAAPPTSATAADHVGPRASRPRGFDTVAGRVTAADGSTCDVCLWAALTTAEQVSAG